MKLSCLQENLNKGLSIVNRFVSGKPQLPVLANVLFEAKEGRLKLKATNLESGITLEVGARIDEEGEIAVSSKTLTELINSLPPTKLELSTEEKNLKIISEKSQTIINSFPVEEFPPLPSSVGNPTFSFETKNFLMPISQVAFAAAQDESRPVLSGVKIISNGKGLILAATDGFRLSVKKIEEPMGTVADLIIPARTLVELARILDEEKEEKFALEINKEGNQVIFSLKNAEIVSRLLEGQFPDFEKIIPQGFTSQAIVAKEELLAAIRTATIFAREAANVVKFEIRNSKFEIMANAPEVGENVTVIEAKTEGEEGEIAFNSRFLLDFLNVVPQEEVVFEMTGPLSPGVFKPVDDESFLHIIMPVRVQS